MAHPNPLRPVFVRPVAWRAPERDQLACPIVRRRARLDADQAGRQLGEELQHAPAGQPLANYRRTLCIHPVHLEHVLREIEAYRRNTSYRGSPSGSPQVILREGWRAVHIITSGRLEGRLLLPIPAVRSGRAGRHPRATGPKSLAQDKISRR
jgi:hypothetical protein